MHKKKTHGHARRFSRNSGGSVAIILGILIIPLLVSAGVFVDYVKSAALRGRLQASADLAALSALAPGEDTRDPKEYARTFFYGNLTPADKATLSNVTVNAISDSTMRQVSLTFAAVEQNAIMKVIGIRTTNVGGTATAQALPRPKPNFYFLLDTSDSMALASTDEGRNRLRAATASYDPNPVLNNCEFACHSDGRLALARSLNVPLRIDDAKKGIQWVLDTVQSWRSKYWDNTRFSVYALSNNVAPVITDSTSIPSVSSSLSGVDIGYKLPLDSSGNRIDANSYFDVTIPEIAKMLDSRNTPNDDIVVLITDGVISKRNGVDPGNPEGIPERVPGENDIRLIDLSYCAMLKKGGRRLAVIYTEYMPIPEDWMYKVYVARIHDLIPDRLRACASDPSYFAHGKTPDEIVAAFNILFRQLSGPARLVK
jgi:Flp pilus assembly protein TadG